MEKPPPVSRNKVLNIRQIRYCMTEKIRIDAFESLINVANNHEVHRFNALVKDYKTRCGEYRYRQVDVERVQRELDPVRESITSAARSEWVRRSLGLQSQSQVPGAKAAQAPQKVKPKQGVTCQSYGECPGNLFCVRGMCAPRVEDGGACDQDTDCEGASQCVSGRCASGDSPSPSS